MENIQDIIEKIASVVDTHKLSDGRYARWITPGKNNRDTGINPYGCADAANILYTIGRFPSDADERAEWIKALREMQDPETGLFNEARTIPSTRPRTAWRRSSCSTRSRSIRQSRSIHCRAGKLEKFLDSLGWYDNPGRSRIRAREYTSR